MSKFEAEYFRFPAGNPWGHLNIPYDFDLSLEDLIWGSITVGHTNLHHTFEPTLSATAELWWKVSMILLTLESKLHGLDSRWCLTDRFGTLDPSEKVGVSFHLGLALTKIVNEVDFGTSVMIHLDTLRRANQIGLHTGDSRADLVGFCPGKGWTVWESKGRSTKASAETEENAKAQATNVASVSQNAPILQAALFTYFKKIRVGTSHQRQLRLRVIDPEPDEAARSLVKVLSTLKFDELYLLYYRPFLPFFAAEKTGHLEREDTILWHQLGEDTFAIGMHEMLLKALAKEDFKAVHDFVTEKQEDPKIAAGQYFGDGLAVRRGANWPMDFHTPRTTVRKRGV